jgi:hypothetical protein
MLDENGKLCQERFAFRSTGRDQIVRQRKNNFHLTARYIRFKIQRPSDDLYASIA